MRSLRPKARWFIAIALALGVAFACPERPVHADEAKEVVGTVVMLDSGDVVIDVGKKQGAIDGDVLELWRPIKVKNPLNGKILTDRFRIGSVKITQARDILSLAKPQGALTRPVEAGDMVILHTTVPTPVVKPPTTATTTAPTGTGTAPPVVVESDPEAKELAQLFEGLHGTSPELRAAAYEEWVRKHPKSRFAGVLTEEAIALRQPVAVMKGTGSSETPVANPNAPRAISWKGPDEVLGNTSFTLGVELAGLVSGAVLHIRRADEPAFSSHPMKAVGQGYYSVVVPKERVDGPTLSYFIEAVGPNGAAFSVVGSSTEPIVTKIVSAPAALTPSKHENTFAIWTDYADYNRWKQNDYAWQTEGFFGMRFDDVGLRAVRSGFGVFKGKGGSIEDLDRNGLAGRPVGLSYGYVEGEWGITNFWALIGRAVIGLNEDGVTGGGQAFVRIGNDKKTNLLLGGEFLGGVGLRGITQVELNLFPRFPILFRTEVTNQPAGTSPSFERKQKLLNPGPGEEKASVADGDLGFRAIAQGGYRVSTSLAIFARVSYQGRTINHAGPGFGGGVTVSW